jgi:hypothetical protein
VTRAHAITAVILGVALGLIYLPDVGHGFVKDDFRWIDVGRVTSFADLPRLFTSDVGFYRPVILASFAADYGLFGLRAFPFALTNLLLVVACAALIVRLASLMNLPVSAGMLAAAAWTFNPRTVGMAVLWISGRTGLFLTLFMLLTAVAALQRQRWRAAGWCFLALLSKEEAVILPFAFAAWTAWSTTANVRWGHALRQVWPMGLALALYGWMRTNTHAFGPFDAPAYYQFNFALEHVARNVGEYLDRSTTFPAAVAVILVVACRTLPPLDERHRRTLVFALGWLIAGFAITVFLPLRSDLYALAPSVGSCLALGVLADSLAGSRPRALHRALAALVVLPFLLLPVYRTRNARWVRPADLSTRTLRDLQSAARVRAFGGHVVLIDDPSAPMTLDSAFEALIADAGRLIGIARLEIVAGGPIPADASDVFRLRQSRLIRASP